MNPKQPDPLLCSTIYHAINMHDKDASLSIENKDKMSKALGTFIESAIDKFINGQREHGGNLKDRDLSVEITNELIDLFWYHSFNKK